MKARISVPKFFTLYHEDAEFKAAFDYEEGEEQWFDARAGVGSPGYPASVSLNEVDFGKGWEPLETYPQLNVDACEQQIMEEIDRLYEAYWAEYAEHMEAEQ
jgi:hypothetical protein